MAPSGQISMAISMPIETRCRLSIFPRPTQPQIRARPLAAMAASQKQGARMFLMQKPFRDSPDCPIRTPA